MGKAKTNKQPKNPKTTTKKYSKAVKTESGDHAAVRNLWLTLT